MYCLRPSLILVSMLALSPSLAAAQTVAASGEVRWGSFTEFVPRSGEVVFLGFYPSERITADLTILDGQRASYAVSLTPGNYYYVTAVLADCEDGAATCATPANPGVRVRIPGSGVITPDGGAVTVNLE